MAQEKWKFFEENLLTHSAAHYLMTINELIVEQGYARVTDIAKALNITRGSCSVSLKPLKRRGLVIEDHNRFLHLSDEGRRLAQLIEKNDELLETFLRDFLGVSVEQAEIDACKLEHLISIETSVKLAHFISFLHTHEKTIKDFLMEMRKHPACCALSTMTTAVAKEPKEKKKSKREERTWN